MPRIFPSLISADLLNLEREIHRLEPHCDGFHLDVMDNQFVPNLTFGPAIVNAIATCAKKQIWVHLMVKEPDQLAKALALPPKSIVSFHCEQDVDVEKMINLIHSRGWLASLALNPTTPIDQIVPSLGLVDQVLIMSVEPGFSGQAFIPSVTEKIAPLLQQKKQNDYAFTLAMDGDINADNLCPLTQSGVQDFAIASHIFKSDNPVQRLMHLKKICKQHTDNNVLPTYTIS